MIGRVTDIIVRAHRPILLAGLGLSVVSVVFLIRPGLREDYTIASLIAVDDEEYHRFLRFGRDFVSGELALFAVDAGDPLEPNNLDLLHWICEQCERIEGVESPTAISELPDLGLWALFKPGGGLQTIRERLEVDPDARDEIEDELRSNPLVVGTLVGQDPNTGRLNTTAGIFLHVVGEAEGPRRKRVADQLRQIRDQARRLRPDATIHLGGPLVGLMEIFESIHRDMAVFTVVVFILICVALWLIFRRGAPVLVALTAAGLSCLCVLGLSIVAGLPMSLVSQTVVVLVTILGVSMCVHLLVAHEETRLHRSGEARGPMHDARETLCRMVLPCGMVAATTTLGFASLFISTLRPIRQLAGLIIAGVLLALLLGLAAIPGLARLAARRSPSPHEFGRLTGALTSIGQAAGGGRGRPIGVVVVFAALVCIFLVKVPAALNNLEADFVKNFREDSNVRRVYQFVQDNLGPVGSIEVVVRRKDGGPVIGTTARWAIQSAQEAQRAFALSDQQEGPSDEYLQSQIRRQLALTPDLGRAGTNLMQAVDELQTAVLDEFDPPIRMAISLVDLVKLASVGRLLGVAMLELPQFEWQFALTMVLIDQKLGPDFLRTFLTVDHQALRINMRALESDDVHRKLEVARKVRDKAADVLGEDYDVQVTGLYPLYAKIAADLLKDQRRTFALALALITTSMCVSLRSVRLGLLSMIPNLMPIVFCLGVMGWADIPINMATAMMLSVALGIAVDNTIHYLWRFRRELDVDQDYAAAIVRTHRTVGRACVFNSVVIVGGFWVLCLSQFVPTVYFGWMIGLTMLGALAGDIILLPMLLTLLRPIRVKRFEV